MKKCLKILKDYQTSRQKARELDAKMDRLYQKNLMKKTLFPWRTYLFLIM